MTAAAPSTGVPARHQLRPAAVAVVAVVLVAGSSLLLGTAGRLVATLVLQSAVLAAWALLGPSVAQSTAAAERAVDVGALGIAGAAAMCADLAVTLPRRPELTGLLAVLGAGFLLLVLRQMLRRPRPAVVGSLAAGALLLWLVSALAVLALAGRSAGAPTLPAVAVSAVGAAVVAGCLADLGLPRPQLVDGVPGGAAGLGAAILVGALVGALGRAELPGVPAVPGVGAGLFYGAALGAVAGLTGLVGSVLAVKTGNHVGSGARAWALPVLRAVLPFAAGAPVAWALQAAL